MAFTLDGSKYAEDDTVALMPDWDVTYLQSVLENMRALVKPEAIRSNLIGDIVKYRKAEKLMEDVEALSDTVFEKETFGDKVTVTGMKRTPFEFIRSLIKTAEAALSKEVNSYNAGCCVFKNDRVRVEGQVLCYNIGESNFIRCFGENAL